MKYIIASLFAASLVACGAPAQPEATPTDAETATPSITVNVVPADDVVVSADTAEEILEIADEVVPAEVVTEAPKLD